MSAKSPSNDPATQTSTKLRGSSRPDEAKIQPSERRAENESSQKAQSPSNKR